METESDLGAKPQQNGGNIIRSSWSSFKLRSESLNTVRLRRIFDIFDKNKDGLISSDELTQALKLLGLDADVSDLDATIRSYIQPGQPGLTFDGFRALHRSINDAFYPDLGGDDDEERKSGNGSGSGSESECESDLSEAFKVFDEDGDGYISARELQAVLEKLGLGEEGKELERVEKMISCVDTNHDGVVDFVEFKDMMRNIAVVPFPSA
ncbi:OLC1v1015685C1 [Oldenlandia corymbosa var. corymbosa]|uniref:OLC1v1015685C1 n=1 Tax=Oldenlandia corymbosa var. corymbosa TaxID=529605 RepID=A0AAV1E633_OLDCO|nr:OLC1v1015685C1 [Oldenlandia corymbosa var. corymbosa]